MKEISVVGIDLAKRIFHLHAVDVQGKMLWAKKLQRERLKGFVANLPKCLIAIEACGSANYWAREFQKLGHEVRLISPQYAKPYVKTNKNDFKDAEAIAEAASRPNMRFVAVKTEEQQDIQNLHRVRSRLIKGRTAVVNEIHGLMGEYGIVLPIGGSKFRSALFTVLELERLSGDLKSLMLLLIKELDTTEELLSECDQRIEKIAKESEVCQRLLTIPGVGKLTATAMVASVGAATEFKNGREFAAHLGLVPRQHSTGGRQVLLGISKRGDKYLRTLLVHGSRSVLFRAAGKEDALSRWATKKLEERGANRAAVALANKKARIIWAVLTKGEKYRAA